MYKYCINRKMVAHHRGKNKGPQKQALQREAPSILSYPKYCILLKQYLKFD